MENSEENYVLSKKIVDNLRCSFCKLYLSFPPIFMTTYDDRRFKCARCTIKTRFTFRDIMYENLARHMKFPCVYEDCKEILCWDDVQKHENVCEYRSIQCLATDCQETVLEKKFADHFKEKHKKLYHSGIISIEHLRSNYGFCVLEKDNTCYVFFYDVDIDKVRMSLCYINHKKSEKQFEVIFQGKDQMSIVLSEQNLIPFQERTHCYRCLKGDCKSPFHLFKDYKRGLLGHTHSKMNKDLLKRTFGNDIACNINVVDENLENDVDLDTLLLGSKDVVIDEVNEEDEGEKPAEPIKTDVIKDLLKCPSCEEHLNEPIFQCLQGHAICKECKSKTEKCSTCETKIDNTRNYLVEEVIMNLKLFKENNTTVDDREIVCPMSKCKDNIKLSDISTHFKNSHLENFHFNKVFIKNIYGYYNVDVLVKDGKTYLLFFDFDDFHFGMSVCSVEPTTDRLFEAKLLSDNKKYTLIASDQKVITFNDKEHCFKCSIGTCKITNHTFRVKRKEIFRRLTTKFNRDCIKSAFKSSSMSYQITIKDSKESSLKVLKQLFECPICKDYMIPPIHQCIAGHTLCNVCKTKVEKCPSCEGSIEDTRNFILENISEVVELPCTFEAENCNFRAGIKRVATHELACPLNSKKTRNEETNNHENNKEKIDIKGVIEADGTQSDSGNQVEMDETHQDVNVKHDVAEELENN